MAAHLPGLRPAERAGLALWVAGTIPAGSACRNAAAAALEQLGPSPPPDLIITYHHAPLLEVAA